MWGRQDGHDVHSTARHRAALPTVMRANVHKHPALLVGAVRPPKDSFQHKPVKHVKNVNVNANELRLGF
jgi:hypothetical protein